MKKFSYLKQLSIYAKERFPVILTLLYSLLYASSISSFLSDDVAGSVFATITTYTIACTLFCFFLRLRLVDDIKDFAYDTINHTDRPVARGDVSAGFILRLALATALIEIGIQLLLPLPAIVAYALLNLYSLLMHSEFFVKEYLAARMGIAVTLHQMIFFFHVLYAASTITGKFFIPRTLSDWLLFPILMAPPLLFELGRKFAHRTDIKGKITNDTYASAWGQTKTFALIMGASFIQIFSLYLASPSPLIALYALFAFLVALLYVSRPAYVIQTASIWSLCLAFIGLLTFQISALL